MDKIICYMHEEGTLAIVTPCAELFDKLSRHRAHFDKHHPGIDTDEQLLHYIAKKDIPEGQEYFILDKSALPEDRYFRNAWKHDNGSIKIHMDKAKSIHLNKLRDIRSQKFIDLGFPQQLNPQVENAILGDDLKATLKELRDFPQNMDLSSVSDPDTLKSLIPDCLK
jgi:hypothetical protein